MINGESEDRKINEWRKDVAQSRVDEASTTARNVQSTSSYALPIRPALSQARSNSAPIVVNQIISSPPVIVTRVKAPEPKPSNEISTKAMIGTVVGATAGAFIAYAMVKGDSENRQAPEIQERITYRTIEAPIEQNQHTTRIPISDAPSYHTTLPNSKSGARTLTIESPPLRIERHVPSQHPGTSEPRSYREPPHNEPIMMIDNDPDTRSRTSVGRKTIRQVETSHLPPSAATATEVRIAREVPLPATAAPGSRYSRASSATIKDQTTKMPAERYEPALPSVVPDDSISQVSTRRSRDSRREKHHHRHRSEEDVRSRRGITYEGRSKAGSKQKSRVGDMVEDVVSVIRGTSSKGGQERR